VFPIWDVVRTFDGQPWRGLVDVVSAGFPCQPFSFAGKRQGADDDRNLWPETIRIIREVGSRYALLENVPGLLNHDYFGEILGDLAAAGFDAEWDVVSAASVGARHRRDRLWVVATNTDSQSQSQYTGPVDAEVASSQEPIPDASGKGLEGQRDGARSAGTEEPMPASGGGWSAEPGVGRVAHGVAHRVDRLKSIGNGQVPAVVARAWISGR
jgi:DNA (cytosine-5)-methyltransferase 1